MPASAVEYWHSELGVSLVGGEVDSWTGQLQGTVLATANGAAQRPAYGVDGSFFGGRPVVRSAITGTRYLKSAVVAPLVLAGSKPHIYWIMRWRTAADQNTAVVFADSLPTATAGMLHLVSSTDLWAYWYPHSPVVRTGLPNTSVCTSETFINSAGAEVFRFNGTSIVGATTGLSCPGDLRAVQIGGDRNRANAAADGSFAFVLLCASEMTAPELAALNAWATAYWGTP